MKSRKKIILNQFKLWKKKRIFILKINYKKKKKKKKKNKKKKKKKDS